MALFNHLERLIDRMCVGIAVAGGLGLIVATIITCVSILLKLGRRSIDAVFGADAAPAALEWVSPILGEEEIVQFAVGAALLAALPFVMIRKGHIRIDLFEPVFGPGLNRFLDLMSDIALAAIAYLIMTRQWSLIFRTPRGDSRSWGDLLLQGDWTGVADRLRDTQESQIIGIKLWPTYVYAEICVAIFFVVAVFCVVRSARTLVYGAADD